MNPHVILVINADPAVEIAARKAVCQNCHSLRMAYSAPEAVRILAEDMSDVDLILLDMGEEMHPAALLQIIESHCQNVPVVVLTDHEANYMRPLVLARGAADCLGKPVSVKTLSETMARYGAVVSQ